MTAMEHRITIAPEPDGMYRAECACKWHSTSAGEQLANWNADGHMMDVRADGSGPLPDWLEEKRYRERMEDLDPLATFPWEI
jgi:hypothetical protein